MPVRRRIASRIARAEPSGSRGRSVTTSPLRGPTLLASTPEFARTNPCAVSVMITPRSMRTTRTASCSTTSTWRASRPHFVAYSTASGRGVMVVSSTMAPSALETIFCVTAITSSLRRPPIALVAAIVATQLAIMAGRSSPGWISPSPSTGSASRPAVGAGVAAARSRSMAAFRSLGVSRSAASGESSASTWAPSRLSSVRCAAALFAPNCGVKSCGRGTKSAEVPPSGDARRPGCDPDQPLTSASMFAAEIPARSTGRTSTADAPPAVAWRTPSAIAAFSSTPPSSSASCPPLRARARPSGSGETRITLLTLLARPSAKRVRSRRRAENSRRSSSLRSGAMRDFAESIDLKGRIAVTVTKRRERRVLRRGAQHHQS